MSDLPKGHWIHAAMAKEKARVGKKKTAAKAVKKPMEAMPASMTKAPPEGGGEYAC